MDDGEPARSAGLFRADALEAARSRLGTPVPAYGLAGWVVTSFLVLLALAVTVFLCTATYSRKESVRGSLAPAAGSQRILSPASGSVAEVLVRDGTLVREGQPLIRLSFDRNVPGGASVETLREASSMQEFQAMAAVNRARLVSLQEQIGQLGEREKGIVQQRQQLALDRELQQKRVGLAESSVAAARTLHERQLIATLQMRQREEALLAARQALIQLDREDARYAADLGQVLGQRRQLAAETAQLAAETALDAARHDEKRTSIASEGGVMLKARRAGRITTMQVKEGGAVAAGSTLAILLPQGSKLEGELWVPSRAIGLVRPGVRVRLLYDAFPYQRFGVGRATVAYVAQAPVAQADIPIPLDAREPLYRVVVRLDQQEVTALGKRWPLAPGMAVTADLVLEERPLIEWIFEPVLAAASRNRGAP